jgi:hypothetical protein
MAAQCNTQHGRECEISELSERQRARTFLSNPTLNEEFARTVEQLLRAWSFPELSRVTYDTTEEDIVISGKARKDNGQGYRAITYAAFMVGVLQETNRKGLPYPGFVLMDSPLLTYREPDEHIDEGVKDAFYRNLATSIGNAQVIILRGDRNRRATGLSRSTVDQHVGWLAVGCSRRVA